MSGKLLRLALALTIAAAPLAACGKKGAPSVPNGEVSAYPRAYPSAASAQNSTPSVPGGETEDADTTTPPKAATPPNAKPNP